MDKQKFLKNWKKVWHFIWEDDSILSWLVNIVLAFVLIKFIVYPGLGLILQTNYPIVAVVSSSMEHNSKFDDWWSNAGKWYTDNDITKEDFIEFPLKNGFNKGDIMVLIGRKPEKINQGDVIVFISHQRRPKADPIIHRVIKKWEEEEKYFIHTKGDNYKTNKESINSCDSRGCVDENKISEEQLIGKAVIKIPLLGYIKIIFVEILKLASSLFK